MMKFALSQLRTARFTWLFLPDVNLSTPRSKYVGPVAVSAGVLVWIVVLVGEPSTTPESVNAALLSPQFASYTAFPHCGCIGKRGRSWFSLNSSLLHRRRSDGPCGSTPATSP